MNALNLLQSVAEARSSNPTRPATAIVHDSAEARLVVFRIAPGQSVVPHRSKSTVAIIVLSGRGTLSGEDGEREVQTGDLITYAANELHGMRAASDALSLVAIIAPRPANAQMATGTA
jgi:quercetin dioxygenase-like cupin family protein